MMKRAFQDITNLTGLSSKNIKLTIHRSDHRRELLRWIYEVCADFGYNNYTYVTALLIVDSYTEKAGFELDEYQLIGISSLVLAAKIEEQKLKRISEYAIVTDSSYTPEEILAKESDILRVLEFNMLFSLPHRFLNSEYFRRNFSGFALLEKTELLHCCISALMEKKSYTKNMYVLYLEAVRELEVFLGGEARSKSLRFYIEKNRILKNMEKIKDLL
ncbi:hypothetical protein ENBRE01_2500 [Enteropsectra breve]|nr:hypothetical protein ENBRE01_2500 [Enteropsectra breve]